MVQQKALSDMSAQNHLSRARPLQPPQPSHHLLSHQASLKQNHLKAVPSRAISTFLSGPLQAATEAPDSPSEEPPPSHYPVFDPRLLGCEVHEYILLVFDGKPVAIDDCVVF